jgi:hypothetical protein
MSKQLIKIQAKFIRSGDLIFDYKERVFHTVSSVYYTYRNNSQSISDMKLVFISYGINSECGNNFVPNDIVSILLDIDNIEIMPIEN